MTFLRTWNTGRSPVCSLPCVLLFFAATATHASAQALAGADPVAFDTAAAALILDKVLAGTRPDATEWRRLPAFALTRQWATWNAQADPDLYVERAMTQALADSASRAFARMRAGRRLLSELFTQRSVLSDSLLAAVKVCLPSGERLHGRVLFAAFIPPFAFAWGDGSIVIDISADFWQGSAERLVNYLVHELFHVGYVAHQQGVGVMDIRDSASFTNHLMWATQNEGMATYCAYKARGR